MAKKTKKKGRIITVDMTNVDTYTLLPEGDYHVKVVEVEDEVGESSGKPYLKWKLEVVKGEYKGTTVYHQTSLQPQALFNLKGTLLALGVPTPKSILDLDLDDLLELEMGVTVEHEKYDGKDKAKVIETFPLDDSGDSEDSEEEETEEEVEEEDAEEIEEMDYSEMDIDELKAECKERGIKFDKKAKIKDLIKLLEENDEASEDEEVEEEEEEEEEPEPEPPKKKKKDKKNI